MKSTFKHFAYSTLVCLFAACNTGSPPSVDLDETGANGLLTPSAIFGRYVQALGGEDVLRSHTSRRQFGTFTITGFGAFR